MPGCEPSVHGATASSANADEPNKREQTTIDEARRHRKWK